MPGVGAPASGGLGTPPTSSAGAPASSGGVPATSAAAPAASVATPGPAVPAADPNRSPSDTVPASPIPRFTCSTATTQVSTGEQLAAALADAAPGQVIQLADGTYPGEFTTTASGTAQQPIQLCGGRGAVIDGGSIKGGYALHFDGAAHWRVNGFTVRNGQKGVMVDTGTDIGLQDLLVEDIGDEAVHLRKFSSRNVVRGLTIRRTGLRRDKFGEGVYVGSAQSNWATITGGAADGSNTNFVLDNTFSATAAESVDIKEGTIGGVVAGNTFDGSAMTGGDSWVDVKGNGWLITDNTGRATTEDGFQTHVIVSGWGDHNVFTKNTAEMNGGQGVGFYLHEARSNRISCNNRVVGGALTNAKCSR
ncbi:MAG TPA: hypothetical protein VLL08_18615 [Kineosporiaceae bacterium]|nr:hypothetical protein [Kineosporiaceae bacterium]